jgi:hypothetical protein
MRLFFPPSPEKAPAKQVCVTTNKVSADEKKGGWQFIFRGWGGELAEDRLPYHQLDYYILTYLP